MKRERGSHVGPERFRAWQNVNEKEERDSKVPPTPRSARESARASRLTLRGPQERASAEGRKEGKQAFLGKCLGSDWITAQGNSTRCLPAAARETQL